MRSRRGTGGFSFFAFVIPAQAGIHSFSVIPNNFEQARNPARRACMHPTSRPRTNPSYCKPPRGAAIHFRDGGQCPLTFEVAALSASITYCASGADDTRIHYIENHTYVCGQAQVENHTPNVRDLSFKPVILNNDFERARNRESLVGCTEAHPVQLRSNINQNIQNLSLS